jgi:tRNA-dihydrouridine synthase B
MAGVTDFPYREVVREIGGCGLIYTEMISAKGLVYNNKRTRELLEVIAGSPPVAVQLFGCEPEILAEASQIVMEESSPEIIDLNVGCPAPKVVKNGYGSALMKTPELLGEIVAAMGETVSCPVTVKIRAGWDQEQINAVKIAEIAADNGAQAVGVHGRTREQFYEGEADWKIIKKVKESVSIPVLGNGDVFSPEEVQEMMAETGCDAVLIARGARGNPWIFKQAAHYLEHQELLSPPTVKERIETAISHLQKLVDYKGEYTGVREMRRHAASYIKGLPHCTDVKQQLNQAETQEKMEEILTDYQASL